MNRTLVLLIGGFLLLGAVLLRAQDPISAQTYGAGVHAYFAGDYPKAHELLTSAIGANSASRDPRMYYFRGLTCLRLGRGEDATLDFQQGAKLETTNTDQTYNISRALERVQGADRQQLEQYRAESRILAAQRAEEQRRARYEQLKRDEERVLLNQSRPAATAPVPPPPDVKFGDGGTAAPGGPAPIAGPTPGGAGERPVGPAAKPGANPLVEDAREVKTPAAKALPRPAVAEQDPFAEVGADTKKAEPKKVAGADVDPFAEAAAETKTSSAKGDSGDVAVKKPAAKKAVKRTADDADTGGDPFGDSGSAAVKKPAAKKAAKKTADDADAGGDPFGDSGSAAVKKPAAKKAAKKTADDADAGGDPFGDSGSAAVKKPAAKKAAKKTTDDADAGGDPFGDSADAGVKKPAAKKAAKKTTDDADTGGDPFGDSGDAGAKKPAAKKTGSKKKAADDSSDPFGGN